MRKLNTLKHIHEYITMPMTPERQWDDLLQLYEKCVKAVEGGRAGEWGVAEGLREKEKLRVGKNRKLTGRYAKPSL